MARTDSDLQQRDDAVVNILTGIFKQLEKVAEQLKRNNDLKINKAKDLVQVQNKVQDFIDFEPLLRPSTPPIEVRGDHDHDHDED